MSARRRPLTLIPIVFVLLSMLWPLGFRAQASGGQPILLVVNSAAPNPFGPYLGEILRAEGIVDFDLVELANLDSATLNNARLAVLAETPLSSGQASMFSSFVAGGGRLVAMRPDAQLDAALGLSRSAGGVAQGYLAINTAHPTGAGLTGVTLPIFGDAARLAPTSGATVAQLYSGRDSATSYSAVIRSGATATWAFDLARSVAYARQGNPANAGQDRDGLPPIRTTDVFHNAIDLERVGLPHADIQMRLFSRTIGDLLADSAPLPRLWYFPDARRTLLVPTGDDHGQPAQHFASMVSNVESRGGRISFYGPRYAPNPTAADTATWRAAGHEVGLHPYAYADGVNLDQAFTTNENWFATQGRGAASRTTRTHQVEWQGWAGAASVEANHNIGMDLSFYTWGPSITRANGSQVQGYITGSGLPMRFVDEGGALIPVYQQVTVLIDEAMFSAISSYAAGLTTEQALAVSRDIIDRSQAGNYSAIATQFHVDYYPFGEVQPWVHGTLDHAASLGIPIWTAERWLRFTEARAATTISGLTWDPQAGTASFQVTVPAGTDAQSLMLPASFDGRSLSGVSVNGASVGVTNESINGRATSFVSLGAGSHSVVASYAGGQAPTSTPTTPTTPTATATGAPTTTPTSTATPSGPTSTPTSSATSTQAPTPPPSSGAQSWTRQVGSCDPALQGAVLGIAGSGCGGGGTSFDALEIYDPAIVKDVATTAAPCAGVAVGATCYRMWYSGESSSGVYRIGHATSPDGRNWTRVVGPGPGGSVLGAGAPGGFDGVGTAYPHVLKDGGTYKLWYVGFDSSYIGGIGYATSTDGVSWTRQGSPVLAPSGVAGSFDRDAPNTPFVIKDRASAAAPCPGIADGATCYRMWYEGVNNEGAYTFRIGYAVSPDGLSWTRVAGPTPSGAVLDRDGSSYEAASVGVPIVIKDGALFRMWYEAKDYAGNFTLLYASSPDGLVWTRSNPSAPVWTGADDPATFAPDNVWGHEVLRDGSTYRMWYSLSTQPDSQRIGLTESSLGTTLSDISLGVAGNQYTLTFSTNRAIPAGGSLLIALPPGVDVATVSPGATSGFGGAALTVVPAALTDAGSHNVARGALLIQLSGAAAPGPKSVQFSLAAPPAQAGEISIRSFTTHDSLEFGATTLPGDPSGPTATATLPPTATGTAGPTSAPTSTSTPGPTSTPASTSTSTPTLSPTPAAGELVHTSVGDFSAACTVADNSWVGTSGGGAVGLRGAFGDSFDGPALGGQWVSGRWSGASFSPSFVEGAMALDGAGGAFVRSQSSFSARTLEAVVDFGSGPWQHVGWGSLDFEGDRYLLFSTFGSSSNLFVRSNNGGSEQNLDLGPVSSGFQHIRIEWRDLGGGQDEVRYFLGGTLRATHTLPSLPSLHVYSSHNSGAGAPALLVDALHALPPYAASGSFTSCALDAGSNSAWSSISWQATTPAGSSVAVETRASSDGLSWTAWAPTTSGASLASPARFLQYRLSLATGDTALSPLVEAVTLTRGAAAAPTQTVTNTPAPTETVTVPTETVTVPTETVTVPTETATVPTATATVPTATATVPTATATVPTATATSQPASTAVGLANGGFELDINADGRPDSWTSDARFTVDTSAGIAYSGGAAGRHQATTNPSYNIDQRAGTGTIVPGKGYTLSGWVNIPATSDSFTFRLQVRWLNSAGTLLSTTTVRSFTAATSGWTQVRSSTLRAPANAATAEVRMNVSSLNATVYVDDLAFELANLLANPGFELDANADNRPDSWTSSARFLRSSTLRSGAAAGNLTATTNPSFTINSSTISGLYAGASHRVSGWVNIPARADDFSLSVQLQWRDSSNVAVGANVPLATHAAVTPGWAGFDQELLVPAGATRAIILLSTTSLNGNIYVDDFRFE
jgi:hypothetical protein